MSEIDLVKKLLQLQKSVYFYAGFNSTLILLIGVLYFVTNSPFIIVGAIIAIAYVSWHMGSSIGKEVEKWQK